MQGTSVPSTLCMEPRFDQAVLIHLQGVEQSYNAAKSSAYLQQCDRRLLRVQKWVRINEHKSGLGTYRLERVSKQSRDQLKNTFDQHVVVNLQLARTCPRLLLALQERARRLPREMLQNALDERWNAWDVIKEFAMNGHHGVDIGSEKKEGQSSLQHGRI